MTTYNFTTKKGDTFDGQSFSLKTSILVSALPTVGTTGVVYKLSTTGVYYEWNGTTYDTVTGGLPIDLTGCSIVMQVRRPSLLDVMLTLSVGAGLTITDAINGVFRIDSQIIDIPVYVYKYDIQITFPNGIVKTYISGTATITEDVTNG